MESAQNQVVHYERSEPKYTTDIVDGIDQRSENRASIIVMNVFTRVMTGYQVGPTESVSEAVLEAIRVCGGCGSRDYRTLYEVVDPDALDDLFASTSDDSPRLGGRVEFIYQDHRVVVEHGEYIEVHTLQPITVEG